MSKLSKKMLDALNTQIKDELYSEYYYLSMSAWCEANDLPGMAAFLKLKSEEERAHAMKLYEYILDRDGVIELQAIPQPPTTFKNYRQIFEKQLEHEEFVTSAIHKLYELSLKENDYPTQVMLQWFVEEQVEEEKEAKDIIQQCKMVGDNESALFLLDQRLGEQVPGEEAEK